MENATKDFLIVLNTIPMAHAMNVNMVVIRSEEAA